MRAEMIFFGSGLSVAQFSGSHDKLTGSGSAMDVPMTGSDAALSCDGNELCRSTR